MHRCDSDETVTYEPDDMLDVYSPYDSANVTTDSAEFGSDSGTVDV